MTTAYEQFIREKSQHTGGDAFEPVDLPDFLYPFQRHLVEWSLRRGRAAIFADCGMGKTAMQLTWADQVRRHSGGSVLILSPLAVAAQTEKEAKHFGIEAARSKDGSHSGGIVITNYERLHLFDATDFVGVVCDESSILKSVSGARQKAITRFMSKMRYRLLCTATAAPNDYVELGTSSGALGELTHSEMIKRFFKMLDDKGQKSELSKQEQAEALLKNDPEYFAKLSFRVAQTIGQWRLKHHAVEHFWRWVSSWARACRMPSDLGFSDEGFVLPPLIERNHIIKANTPPDGFLFQIPAIGLKGEREERRRTLAERCDFAADLVDHDRPAVVWCHLDEEGDTLERRIPGAKQIAGKTSDDDRERIYESFSDGSLRVLVIKPKIGAWGLNWQHCNHVVTFASHSYEQFYQAYCRCYRFGQKRTVTLDEIATEGEERVIANRKAKAVRAANMFTALVREMRNAERIQRVNEYTNKIEVPSWL
jgi:hypothetical protein